MNSSMTVQAEPEVTLQNIRPVSDLGPHVEVTQIRIEKIRFMWFVLLWKERKTLSLPSVYLGHFCLQSEHSLSYLIP